MNIMFMLYHDNTLLKQFLIYKLLLLEDTMM